VVNPKPAKSSATVKRVVQARSKGGTKRTVAKKGQRKAPQRPAKPAPKPEPPTSEFIDLQNQVFALAPLAPRNAGELGGFVAATWDGLFRTDEEKKGWKRLRLAPVGAAQEGRVLINAVATSPHAPGLILIGTEEGLLVSRDNGESFAPMPLDGEPRRVRVIRFDPRNAGGRQRPHHQSGQPG
jgi:hypothetical protein